MKQAGPPYERETIIRWDVEGANATIWTANGVVYNRLLKRLGRAHLIEDGERHAIFSCPKQWIILPKFKIARKMTPERKEKMAKARQRGK